MYVFVCSCDCGQMPMSPQMERQYPRWTGWTVPPWVKRAKRGRTHRHKMGGARFDMSAPDIKDKPERAPNNDQDEMILCTIPNRVADRVADEWM